MDCRHAANLPRSSAEFVHQSMSDLPDTHPQPMSYIDKLADARALP